MASSPPVLRDLYTRAATVEGKPGLFFIGPFGKRVSFASQQRRALNTVWALNESGTIAAGRKVAVIGGGLAGITTATALAARNCLVWLFEARPRLLGVQETSVHRFVHPTISFWPEVDLRPTTVFPFFDWHADVCNRVIEDIHQEWEAYFAKRLSGVVTNTSVKAVESTADGKFTLETEPAINPREFHAVVFTTGFGEERLVAGTHGASYWIPDHLYDRRETKNGVLVSGTGDGGLIDALRVLHRKAQPSSGQAHSPTPPFRMTRRWRALRARA